jgi:thiazole/oxazole-forming peptide maturase SagD family component
VTAPIKVAKENSSAASLRTASVSRALKQADDTTRWYTPNDAVPEVLYAAVQSAFSPSIVVRYVSVAQCRHAGVTHAELTRAFADAVAVDLMVLLDIHALHLLRGPAQADEAWFSNAAAWILEGEVPRGYQSAAKHLIESGTLPVSIVRACDAVPLLARLLVPGSIASWDAGDDSLRVAQVHPHPALDVSEPRQAMEGDGDDSLSWPSLRSGPPPDLDDLVNRFAGPVRAVRHQRDQTGQALVMALVTASAGTQFEATAGRDDDTGRAKGKALCEALERIHLMSPVQSRIVRHQTFASLKGRAVNPHDLMFRQVSPTPHAALASYHADLAIDWVSAEELHTRMSVLVPAQDVWFRSPWQTPDPLCVATTTNGCAIGTSLAEASIHAVFELIERDSYLLRWYAKRQCPRIDVQSIRDAAFQGLYSRWCVAFPQFTLSLYDLRTDIRVPSVLAIARLRRSRQSGARVRCVHAAATRATVAEAASSALGDLGAFDQTPSPQQAASAAAMRRSPVLVQSPEDHFWFHAMSPDTYEVETSDAHASLDASEIDAESAWLNRSPSTARAKAVDVLNELIAHLQRAEVSLYRVDLTSSLLRSRGLACAKILGSFMYPMWFGEGTQRFEETERYRRVLAKWIANGEADGSATQLSIHPFW